MNSPSTEGQTSSQSSVHVVSLGGTIGSSSLGDRIEFDPQSRELDHVIGRFCQARGLTITSSAPFEMLSEELTPDYWPQIVDEVSSLVHQGHEAIVVTHGTDTMAYSAAALSMIFADTNARIVLTGSFYGADHPKSDVEINISAAIVAATSANLAPGVYVSFGDLSDTVPLIPGMDLLPMRFDSRKFDSRYDNYLGYTSLDVGFRHFQKAGYESSPMPFRLGNPESWSSYDSIESKVFQLVVYPGMDAKVHTSQMPAGSVVLCSMYHSGTADGRAYPSSLAEVVAERTDLKFVFGPVPSAVNPPYASTVRLIEAGASAYRDLTHHALYVWLTLGQMAGHSVDKLLEKIADHRL